MHCADRDHLMADALDGMLGDGLPEHLATCAECARELERLQNVERWLRADDSVDPPSDLAHRVERAIAEADSAESAWRALAVQLALLGVGTLGGAWVTITAAGAWSATLPDRGTLGLWEAFIRGVVLVVRGAVVVGPVDFRALAAVLAVLIASATGVLWFAATVLPRSLAAGRVR